MGVKDLWQLLSPVGRRVSIETLAGKTLAIDASIWITQFIKAMRDESGKVFKNAHIIGTLRRILKLMFNKIKPVFVFDGATPTLKIQTVRNRRKLRERQEVNLKKQAERILMGRLKQYALDSHRKATEAAAAETETEAEAAKKKMSSKRTTGSRYADGFNPLRTARMYEDDEERNEDEEERDGVIEPGVVPAYRSATILKEGKGANDEDNGDDEEVEWEEGYSLVKSKPSKTLSDDDVSSRGSDDEDVYDVPEMFTDLMTESPGGSVGVDIDVLAALPAHMRKAMIEQARTKERKRKRQNYIPVAADPSLYSLTQVANFLRASKLNKVISATQALSQKKDDEGEFMGGTVNKIAADGNRRYVMFDDNDELDDSDEDEIDDNVETISSSDGDNARSMTDITHANEASRLERLKTHVIMDDSNSDNSDANGGGFCCDDNDDGGGFIASSVEVGTPVIETDKECDSCSFFNPPGAVQCEFCGVLLSISTSSRLGQETVESIEDSVELQHAQGLVCVPDSPVDISREGVTDLNYLHAGYEDDEDDVEWESASEKEVSEEEEVSEIESVGGEETKCVVKEEVILDHVDELPPAISHKDDKRGMVRNNTGSGAAGINSDLLMRAVSSASGMGDWAGRAVRRVLEGHIALNNPDNSERDIHDVNKTCSVSIPFNDQASEENAMELKDSRRVGDLDNTQSDDVVRNGVRSGNDDVAFQSTANESNSSHLWSEHQGGTMGEPSGSDTQHFSRTGNLEERDPYSMRSPQFASEFEDADTNINSAMNKALRDTQGLTSEMVEEVKQLLDIFHLPWVTAPFEAEAQCAYLEQQGLVQGVVTEDSDVFLFGGECVYKNMFDEKKYVEVYLAEDAKRELGVSRSEFVCLSYLLGSDYTEGVRGVGIVNAMEVLATFGKQSVNSRENDGLDERAANLCEIGKDGNGGEGFGHGFMSSNAYISSTPQLMSRSDNEVEASTSSVNFDDEVSSASQILKEVTGTMEEFKNWLFEGHDFVKTIEQLKGNHSSSGDEESVSESIVKLRIFDARHAKARTRWSVPDSFPNKQVAEAYVKPMVNKSTASFTFSSPELYQIQDFCRDILGWTEDEIRAKISPVIQIWLPFLNGGDNNGEITQQQRRIDSFYHTYHDNTRVAKICSNRLREAVRNKKTGIGGRTSAANSNSTSTTSPTQDNNDTSRKNINKRSRDCSNSGNDDYDDVDGEDKEDEDFIPTGEKSRRSTAPKKMRQKAAR